MMEQELKPYPEYKSINISWLIKIPEHWNCERAKNIFIKMNRVVEDTDETITCFRDGIVTLRRNRRTTGFTESLKEIGYQGIRKGDLIIHQMDAFAGSVGVSDSDGKGTPVYSVCVPKSDEYNNYYYAHLVREMGKNGFIQSLYRGIRERSSDFRFETFAKLELPIPSRTEQDQIVKYLDFKLSKINKFIKDKKREIELLKELKQAEINHAVTKGLNPNVPMKDSGIDWLGEIPEHWEVRRLKKCVKLINEKGSPNGGIYVGLENIVSWTGKYIKTSTPDADGISNQFIKNDILYGKLRPYLAKCIIAGFDGICSSELLVLRDFIGVNSYLQMVLISYDLINYINSSTYGAKMPRASWNFIGNCSIPLPPADEQQSIINCLNKKIESLDKLISAIEQKIAFAQEYKTSLISDVVTGKVDVRDVKIEDTFDMETLEEVEAETEEVIEE